MKPEETAAKLEALLIKHGDDPVTAYDKARQAVRELLQSRSTDSIDVHADYSEKVFTVYKRG